MISASGSSSAQRRSQTSSASVGCGLGGKREPERRSLPRQGVHVERPAVRFGDRARDEEAEPRAGLRAAALGPAELLEDQPLLLARDARTAVADLNDDAAVF